MTDVEEAFTSTIDMEDILTRLHTQCDYERLESEMERMKEELDQERMRALELDNRIADLSDGRNSMIILSFGLFLAFFSIAFFLAGPKSSRFLSKEKDFETVSYSERQELFWGIPRILKLTI
ncbi:unnamed protein product [Cylicostephanus goldi]|uniref:Coiled-coil domain-containing protein 167 n=1 Tax=Cylicostephanus goldi TaxID=71465 RepID=A0A3P6RVZ8_CYLGO|nr:unnamed protein product [Cylicostephanus goldi]